MTKEERQKRKVRNEDDPTTDFIDAGVDGEKLHGRDGWIDITGADDIEIMIKDDGRVLWINGPMSKVRICGIRGRLTINDMRSRRQRTRDRDAR